MYRVLIPIESDSSIDATEYVTGLPDSAATVEVVLVHVASASGQADESTTIPLDRLEDTPELPDALVTAAHDLADLDFEVTVRLERGAPSDEILRVAEEVDADTVAMAGRKRSATGKVVFGSVIQNVLLEADRPVTVLRR